MVAGRGAETGGRWAALAGVALVGLVAGGAASVAAEAGAGQRGRAAAPARPARVVELEVRADGPATPISPFVYGANHDGGRAPVTWVRLGGNRWSAYNWTNNASNAGTDWHNQNDGLLGGGEVPAGAVKAGVERAFARGQSVLVTIPMLGHVAADKRKGGDVGKTKDYLTRRFRPSLPARPAAGGPRGAVYQDAFVALLEKTFPGRHDDAGPRLFYGLDNEPALWPTTHPRIHPEKTRYDEVLSRSVAYAEMIKAKAPDALVFGPASYGWKGMMDLQDAPDAEGRVFLAAYLDAMREAGARRGRRLLDVLDVHWYPEVRVDGARVSRPGGSAAVARARVQATRSLWDPSYTEPSWIGRWGSRGPVRLIPRLEALVARHDPGLRLALTEYDFGGGGDPSGAVAQADALGIFGREGLFAAAVLTGRGDPADWLWAAFRMYRDYDGRGGRFGSQSVPARTGDLARVTVYGSLRRDGRVVVVAVNKATEPTRVRLKVRGRAVDRARVYRLAGTPAPRADGARAGEGGVFEDVLPPMSVTTYELGASDREGPEGGTR